MKPMHKPTSIRLGEYLVVWFGLVCLERQKTNKRKHESKSRKKTWIGKTVRTTKDAIRFALLPCRSHCFWASYGLCIPLAALFLRACVYQCDPLPMPSFLCRRAAAITAAVRPVPSRLVCAIPSCCCVRNETKRNKTYLRQTNRARMKTPAAIVAPSWLPLRATKIPPRRRPRRSRRG